MADKIVMEIVTPERLVLREEVDEIKSVPASQGCLGVLPNHAPLITSLEPGVLEYTTGGQNSKIAVSGGFMEVFANKVTILADTAENSDEIDMDRARRAKDRAERRLKERPDGLDIRRAELALRRAVSRIKAAE
ncbi:F0F1 ATP synthase subunit epsilon [Bacillota bacterium LX-D]|nr:F0F1 ATP synthase subunit epsilon [Bacillota bacterium LX-D]